jgi:hypothetical protein
MASTALRNRAKIIPLVGDPESDLKCGADSFGCFGSGSGNWIRLREREPADWAGGVSGGRAFHRWERHRKSLMIRLASPSLSCGRPPNSNAVFVGDRTDNFLRAAISFAFSIRQATNQKRITAHLSKRLSSSGRNQFGGDPWTARQRVSFKRRFVARRR